MTARHYFLGSYRVLLRLYPAAFRKRFAPEMLEIAASAEAAEWPLIFADTSLGIARCWVEGSRSTAIVVEPGAYVPVDEFPVRFSGIVRGFAIAFVITFGLWYLNYLYPTPMCPSTHTLVTPLVDVNARQTAPKTTPLMGIRSSANLNSNR